ncbi:MAG: SufD family Fe-S cluster assembly protein, partial [Methermicoccaceae archaeon]
MSGEMSEKTSDKSESELPALEGTRERLESVGITLNENERSGVFMQVDQSPEVISKARDGVEVMPLSQAMEKYPWVAELRWSLVDRDKDEYTKMADSSEGVEGYFIRALPGAKVEIPVEACLYLKTAGHIQKVHNILIAEEGSELNVISGCASHPGVISGMHVGVSEFFVRKDAKLNFTMIHRWDSDIEVRPRSAAFVDEGGTFISNYVIMGPVKLVQLYPRVRVKKDGMAVFSNIVVAPEGSMVDVGSYAALEEPGASVDMISRVISNGGKMITRGHIVAESNDVNGHLECRGLMLSKEG